MSSSQVKLTLRPPPNVDFVHGYPGIPPGPERPQAAVKGAIEVRTGPQGAKAKWVRIELRKVETLPGGGSSNTFHDFVGPSPVNLWSSSEEYGLLHSQDFPFSIRIPESIPPSIDLQNRAGINYELVASICTKGKKGFLRKRKSVVVSTQADVLIDKHELHSTWPVYCQPEARNIAQEGVTLVVQRQATCYGPGDRITLHAIVRSDALHTVILRGFELTLKESTSFRAGPYTSGRKTSPQVRVVTISENKFPVNATLYGGTENSTELSCLISPEHTTTTLNAARHIDITYTISVKAQMGTGAPLIMDLPVVLSNWQRSVSAEAVRRIGPVPSLSLSTLPIREAEPETHQPATFAGRDTRAVSPPAIGYNTLPNGNSAINGYAVDEFGASRPAHRVTASRSSNEGSGRPSSDRNRLTIHNSEAPSQPAARRQPSANSTTAPTNAAAAAAARNRAWMSAEEEKQRLYQEAKNNVERTQAMATARASPPPAEPAGPTATPSIRKRWPTAEEEKTRLFSEAQAAVKRTQGMDYYAATEQQEPHGESTSESSSRPVAGGSQASSRVPQYLSAEEEKAALRRYHEAKQAVDRVQGNADEIPGQNGSGSAPVAYDSLYPSPSGSSTNSSSIPSEKERLRRMYASQDAVVDQSHEAPPPFLGRSLSEKEQLQRRFDAQDAEARRTNGPPHPPPRSGSTGPGSTKIMTALEEKALLKAKYASEEAAQPPANHAPPHVNGVQPPVNGAVPRNGIMAAMPNTPPPLMPRPPAEYIQETQEEDARVSRFVTSNVVPSLEDEVPLRKTSVSPGLEFAPFTPFTPGFDPRVPGPPPPLPPKLAE